MSGSAPSAVGELLPRVFPQLADRLLEQSIRREWRSIVGAEVARRSEPGPLSGDCLNVIVDNSPWLQELTLRTPDIVSRLTARFGSRIRSLRVGLGAVDRVTPAASTAPRPLSTPELTKAERRLIDQMVAGIPDPALADSVRRLLVKSRRSSPERGER